MYVGGGSFYIVQPKQKNRTVLQFLVPPNTSFREAWILAKNGQDHDGPLTVRLTDSKGSPLSDEASVYNTGFDMIEMKHVYIPDVPKPQLIKVVAENKSTVVHTDGLVEGILLL